MIRQIAFYSTFPSWTRLRIRILRSDILYFCTDKKNLLKRGFIISYHFAMVIKNYVFVDYRNSCLLLSRTGISCAFGLSLS